jgi:hypothetical protein
MTKREVVELFDVSVKSVEIWVATVPGFPVALRPTPGTTRFKQADVMRYLETLGNRTKRGRYRV